MGSLPLSQSATSYTVVTHNTSSGNVTYEKVRISRRTQKGVESKSASLMKDVRHVSFTYWGWKLGVLNGTFKASRLGLLLPTMAQCQSPEHRNLQSSVSSFLMRWKVTAYTQNLEETNMI